MKKPYIFLFDLETTGLKWAEVRTDGTRVVPVEIAAVILDGDLNLKAKFHQVIKPAQGARWERGALDLHVKAGRNLDFFEKGAPPAEVYAFLREFLGHFAKDAKLIPAGHNHARFDIGLLVREASFYGVDLDEVLDYHGGLDTSGMAYERFVMGDGSLESVSLRNVAPRVGVSYEKPKAHKAQYDVDVTVEVLRKLISGEYPVKEA